MATPFIDALTTDRRLLVSQKSKGSARPSYYNATVAADQGQFRQTQSAQTTASQTGRVQISEDTEAALILTSNDVKNGLITFIQKSIDVVTNTDEDDFLLMEEVLSVRTESYEQVFRDVGQEVSEFDTVRSSFLSGVDENARAGSPSDVDAAVTSALGDFGSLLASLVDARTTLSRPDDLAVHDRIADAGVLYTFQNAGTERSKELSSWIDVITAYLV